MSDDIVKDSDEVGSLFVPQSNISMDLGHTPPSKAKDLLGDINARIDSLQIQAMNAQSDTMIVLGENDTLKREINSLWAQREGIRQQAFRDGWTAHALFSETNTLETAVNHYTNLKKNV